MATKAQTLEAITLEDLRELAGMTGVPTISMFLPMKRVNVEPEENSIPLKNMLRRARQKLEERNHRKPQIEELLQPIEALDDNEFWTHQKEGLALFRSEDMFRWFQVPVTLEEGCYVEQNPIVRPLVAAVSTLDDFFILCLSQGKMRLVHATLQGVEEIDLEPLDIPLNLDEALRYDNLEQPDMDHWVTTNPGAAAVASRNAGQNESTMPGHGAEGEEQKRQLARYFHMVEKGIAKLLRGYRTPMILAGVEYLHPIYRDISDYEPILDQGIEGNADGLRAEELQQKAVPIFEQHMERRFDAMSERYGDLAAHGRGSSDLADILSAAHEGRIEYLFMAEGHEAWGTFDPARRSVELHDERQATSVELYDLATRMTLQTSGRPFLMPEGRIPGDPPISATLRY